MARGLVSVLAALLSLVGATGSVAESDARQWLERMSMAARSLNYSGIFVYQHHGRLEAMQVVHAMDEAGERERLFSLTGPEREVLRDNKVVTCILGDQQSVMVNRSRPRTSFPVSFPRELMGLERYYSFSVGGEDRVAGLDCKVVEVSPRDAYRYGRRLCVHEDSHLVLRSELTGPGNQVIEQVMFTSIEFPEKIPRDVLLPELNGTGFTWEHQPEQEPPRDEAAGASRWEVGTVPAGFMLTDHNWHHLSAQDAGVEHWVYSDGLASVSVYIEKSHQAHDSYSGVSHRGALNAFGTMVSGYYVTVVGEVPRETVELIGNSVRLR
ncbi:MAG: MucB/RseB C-terminal domain-containing protein [Gammaproteobacteria bacterium]|jgi:sigma-E factor negative regulatory protein RseB